MPNVSGRILAKVIEYCKYHVEANKKVEDRASKTEDDIKVSNGRRVQMLCFIFSHSLGITPSIMCSIADVGP